MGVKVNNNSVAKAMKLLEAEEVDDKFVRQLREERASRILRDKYRYYEPNGKCEEYIKAVGSGDYFVVMFSAANGVGKTAVSANVVANIVFENLNPYFDYPLYNKWPYPKQGRIVSYPSNLEGVVGALKEWLPGDKYKSKKRGKSYDSFFESNTGWKWDLMTTEQDPKEFEGPTLGWVWFDEIPPMSIYKACVSRLRKGGIIFISATPLEGSGWLYDHIVEAHSDDEDKDLNALAKGQRLNIEAGVEAACKQHGIRGHLEHEDIQKMTAEYSEDEKQARVYGKFQHLAGLVFKQWSRNVHMIPAFQIDRRNYSVYEMLDPHPRNEDAVLWVAINSRGQKFVVDELYVNPLNGIEELAMQIKEKAEKYRIVRRLADPSAFNEDQHTQRSLATDLSKYGLNYIKATKFREAANKKIETELSYIQLPDGSFAKAPGFYVFNTLKRLPWEMEHWRWDEWSGKTGDSRDRKEKPIDKDDHMIENLGRCLIQEPVFVPMETFSQRSDEGLELDPFDNPMA